MWTTDTMYRRLYSLDGNRYAQVFSNGTYFSEIYPMAQKSDAGQALKTFSMELDVPKELMVDVSKEKNSPDTDFMKCFWRNDILLTRTKPETSNYNLEVLVIRSFQRRWF